MLFISLNRQHTHTCAHTHTYLTFQTAPGDVRVTSALIAAAKKTPVVTPPTLSYSSGLSVLISHWSLAISLHYLYKGSISPKSIDRALVSAGYLKGPFQTMKKVSWCNR